MVRSLNGYSVLITGGGSGIGAGTARYLAENGARVTLCGRRAERVAKVAQELGESALAVQADITLERDREKVVEAAVAHGGGLDGLVNNAGNMYRGPLATLDEDKLQALFHSNVTGGVMLSAACLPHLERSKGAIVFLGSIHNRRAFPEVLPYAATKGAVEAVTRSLAAELGSRGIRVNCVAPGAVLTEINQRAGLMTDEQAAERLAGMSSLHALRRIGTTEEVAEAIAYYLTAEWTTGSIMDVDGGLGLGLTEG